MTNTKITQDIDDYIELIHDLQKPEVLKMIAISIHSAYLNIERIANTLEDTNNEYTRKTQRSQTEI